MTTTSHTRIKGRTVALTWLDPAVLPDRDSIFAVSVVPITDDGRVVLARLRRGPEIPGGGMEDLDADPEQTARREAWEEARVLLGELTPVQRPGEAPLDVVRFVVQIANRATTHITEIVRNWVRLASSDGSTWRSFAIPAGNRPERRHPGADQDPVRQRAARHQSPPTTDHQEPPNHRVDHPTRRQVEREAFRSGYLVGRLTCPYTEYTAELANALGRRPQTGTTLENTSVRSTPRTQKINRQNGKLGQSVLMQAHRR